MSQHETPKDITTIEGSWSSTATSYDSAIPIEPTEVPANAEELTTPLSSKTPLTPSSASSPVLGPSVKSSTPQEYVNVTVRLKPKLNRMPDAFVQYSVEYAAPPYAATPLTTRSTCSSKGASSPEKPWTARSIPASTGASSSRGAVLTLTGSGASGEERRSYNFSQVLDATASDSDMCDVLVPGILKQVHAGYNVCVLCYGQTGSGKTHTINALAPAITEAMFRDLTVEHDVVEVSYVQIYREKAYDLLAPRRDGEAYGAPLPRPHGTHVFEPKRLVRDAAEVQSMIKAAQKYRCTSSHTLNARSSRSHTLLSLHTSRWIDGAPLTTSTITLADLAGAERVKKSGAAGDVMDEAIGINRSLFALHSLILATVAGLEMKPYRESLLNLYLAPRLRSWHMVLVITVSLEKNNFSETKGSLEFATAAKRLPVIKRKSQAADQIVAGAESYEDTCRNLRAVVNALRRQISTLQEKENEREFSGDGESIKKKVLLFRSLLAEREEELQQLYMNDNSLPEGVELPRRIGERNQERTLKLLAELTSRSDVDSSVMDGLTEAFLCANALLDSAHERDLVQQRALEGLRYDNGELSEELGQTRRQVKLYYKQIDACHAELREAERAKEALREEMETLRMGFYADYIEWATERDMADLYRGSCLHGLSSATASDEKTLEDQQTALANLQLEIVTCNEAKRKLQKDYDLHVSVIKSMWDAFTPQQKARYCDSYDPGNVSGISGQGSNSAGDSRVGSSARMPSSQRTAAPLYNVSFSVAAERAQLSAQLKEVEQRHSAEVIRREHAERRLEDAERQIEHLRASLQHTDRKYVDLEREQQYILAVHARWQQQLNASHKYFTEQSIQQADLLRQLRSMHGVQEQCERLRRENEALQQQMGTLQRKFEVTERDTELGSITQRYRESQGHGRGSVGCLTHSLRRSVAILPPSAQGNHRPANHAEAHPDVVRLRNSGLSPTTEAVLCAPANGVSGKSSRGTGRGPLATPGISREGRRVRRPLQ